MGGGGEVIFIFEVDVLGAEAAIFVIVAQIAIEHGRNNVFLFDRVYSVIAGEVCSVHFECAANLSFAEFSDQFVGAFAYGGLFNLIIFHEHFADFIFEDADSFIIGLLSNSGAQIFLSILEAFFVFGVDWCQ